MSGRRYAALTALGYALCVIPPLFAVLLCFPLWIQTGGGRTLSGISVILAVLAALPFLRQIREYLRSPSVFVIWLVISIIMTVFRGIIDQMILVSYVALVSNTLGALVFRIRKREAAGESALRGKREPGAPDKEEKKSEAGSESK